jgi:hypothetical protein
MNRQPITPARFIELLDESEGNTVKLWHATYKEFDDYFYVCKSENGNFWHSYRENAWERLHFLYETPPKTLYNRLYDELIESDGIGNTHLPKDIQDEYRSKDSIKNILNRYKSKLETFIMEDEDDETI